MWQTDQRIQLHCTQPDPETWNCNNDYQCSGSAIFSSKFAIGQSNTSVSQTQNFTIGGSTFRMQQDGTGNATLFSSTTSIVSTPATVTGSSGIAASSTKQGSDSTETNPLATQTRTGTSSPASTSQVAKNQSSRLQNPPSYSIITLLLFLAMFVLTSQAEEQVSGFKIGQTVTTIFEVVEGSKIFSTSSKRRLLKVWMD
jgi:hypothetical protein